MSTSNYDDVAIKRAKEFANNENLAHAYVEKPTMYRLLPSLKGKKVLCLGCGTGEECTELLKRGATVFGVDVSKVSIAYAKEHVPDARFAAMDMDTDLHLLKSEGPFDFIYSSLTIHYSNDVKKLFKALHSLLAPQGELLFSVCHPVKWSAETYRHPEDNTTKSFIMGYERKGKTVQVFGNYLEEQHLTQRYPDGLHVDYWMRPPSSYFRLLATTGFAILDFLEPSPLPTSKQIDPTFWEINHKLPQWIVFLARKQ